MRMPPTAVVRVLFLTGAQRSSGLAIGERALSEEEKEKIVKTKLITIALAMSMLGGVAGRVLAETADEINPNDTRSFYDQMDREGRGGQGQG